MSSYGLNGYDDDLESSDYKRGYKDGYEDGRNYESLDHNCHDICEECNEEYEYGLGRAEGLADYKHRLEALEHAMYWKNVTPAQALQVVQRIIQDMGHEE